MVDRQDRTRFDFFWVWCLLGAAFTLGVISLGVLLEVPALLAALILATSKRARPSAFGLLSGASAICFLVVALHLGDESTEGFDVLPWLVAALLLNVPTVLIALRKPH